MLAMTGWGVLVWYIGVPLFTISAIRIIIALISESGGRKRMAEHQKHLEAMTAEEQADYEYREEQKRQHEIDIRRRIESEQAEWQRQHPDDDSAEEERRKIAQRTEEWYRRRDFPV